MCFRIFFLNLSDYDTFPSDLSYPPPIFTYDLCLFVLFVLGFNVSLTLFQSYCDGYDLCNFYWINNRKLSMCMSVHCLRGGCMFCVTFPA